MNQPGAPTIIAVLGGGQLGRMLALAGIPMGLTFRFLDPDPEAPAREVGELICAKYDDQDAITPFCAGATVATYEFENVPVATARAVMERGGIMLAPGLRSLEVTQDRLKEKQLFTDLGIPTAGFVRVESEADVRAALEDSSVVGLPAVLKTRRMGYDGKGQAVIGSIQDISTAWIAIHEAPAILESLIPFDRELSIIGVRPFDGVCRFYPLNENVHRHGILHRTIAPAPNLTEALQAQAESMAVRLMHHLDHVGIFTLELFESAGRLLANETAPRVHNSGHWTIEGAETSQFENHLRAILHLPLGDTSCRFERCAMINLIGNAPTDREALLRIPGVHFHWYAKAPRPGRKIGHITLCPTAPEVQGAGTAADWSAHLAELELLMAST